MAPLGSPVGSPLSIVLRPLSERPSPHPLAQVPGQKVGLIAARRTGQLRGRKEVDDRDKK